VQREQDKQNQSEAKEVVPRRKRRRPGTIFEQFARRQGASAFVSLDHWRA